MPVSVKCAICDESLAFADDNAGDLVYCIHCGSLVQVPGQPAYEAPEEQVATTWPLSSGLSNSIAPAGELPALASGPLTEDREGDDRGQGHAESESSLVIPSWLLVASATVAVMCVLFFLGLVVFDHTRGATVGATSSRPSGNSAGHRALGHSTPEPSDSSGHSDSSEHSSPEHGDSSENSDPEPSDSSGHSDNPSSDSDTKAKPGKATTEQERATNGVLTGRQNFLQNAPAVVIVVSFDSEENELGLGSGFAFDAGQGPVLMTNAHVVENASSVLIRTYGEIKVRIDEALLVDHLRDIAVLPMPQELVHLSSIRPPVNDAEMVQVGDSVYAIGIPRGMEFTFTRGVVSQIRDMDPLGRIVQTDASISPGSSGGPLLSEAGLVVGMNTLVSRATLGANNLNIAVASSSLLTASNSALQASPQPLARISSSPH